MAWHNTLWTTEGAAIYPRIRDFVGRALRSDDAR